MAFFKKENIADFEHVYKINLMNSLSGYKSANLIGTVSEDGVENVAVFSSIVHLGSQPPLLGYVMRPTTVSRDTYKNIKEKGFYTINHISESIIKDAHHTSAKYDATVSEFDMTDLSSEYIKDFKAPFVKQSPVKIGMKYVDEYHIKANDTILVVGEIQFFEVEDAMLQEDGFLNLSKGKVAAINGLDGYAIPELKIREQYQRPRIGIK